MEIRINLALLAILWVGASVLTASQPEPSLNPVTADTERLAHLEDGFARDRGNLAMARELALRYLELNAPGLAVAVLGEARPELLEDPVLAHRLAQAYEASDRVDDALATATLAVLRCGRSLGTIATSATPMPRYGCTERDYAALDMHRAALAHMVRLGVSAPRRDPRTQLAYDLAIRRATVASVAPPTL